MSIISTSEIFDFMGSGDEVRTEYDTMMQSLIVRTTDSVEKYIGRKLTKTAVDIKIHNGRYCSIVGQYLYLTDIYYDLYSITTLIEDDITLTENTNFIRTTPNILERINSVWSQANQLGIEITGYTGLIDPSDDTQTLPALKEIVIEACAARSGLWGKVVEDGQGNVFQLQKSSLPKITKDQLEMYKLPVVS